MEVLSPTTPNGITKTVETADPLAVLEHIVDLIQTTLGAARRELESVGSLLSKAHHGQSLERCSRFATDGEVALFAQKDLVESTQTNGQGEDDIEERYTYSLSPDFPHASTTVSSVAFLKSPTPLDARTPLSRQLNVLNLPGLALQPDTGQGYHAVTSPFEILHSIVHNALGPYFNAYAKTRSSDAGGKSWYDADAKTGIPAARKRMAELEMSLLQLQQNTDIPQVDLRLHPLVQETLQNAKLEGRPPSVQMIPADLIDNSILLNALHNIVNGWIKSIQQLANLTKDSECGSAAQEINFWISMEAALKRAEDDLLGDGIELTLAILKAGKRHQASVSFTADTGLKEALETVRSYNQLMRDFPLDELSSATSMIKVQEALLLIFTHFNKKLRLCNYPIRRALKLMEGISQDLDAQIHRLLRGRSLMQMAYPDFLGIVRLADSIWETWEDSIRDFTNVARDITRKRTRDFVPIKIVPRHTQTQERLEYVKTFRNNHEQLRTTILNVLGSTTKGESAAGAAVKDGAAILEELGDVDAVVEVDNAYGALHNVDVLDISADGTGRWVQAEVLYNERTSRVENSIISRLRDRLATAKTANEMFRVFAKFNALLVRPKVRGAIGEYQSQLLDNVKNDITALQERFKQQYGDSEAQMMAQLHDLPPVAGSIIWVRQIEAQLDAYMKKVEAVLGSDWTLHTDGERLLTESNLFRKKLNPRPIFETWLNGVQKRNLAITGRLFNVVRPRGTTNTLELTVNFDSHVVSMFKEVRNLTNLNYQVPHMITTHSKDARRVYPYALSLMESVTGYLQTSRTISTMPDVAQLLAGYEKEVQNLIAKGLPLRWESIVHSYELHLKQNPTLASGSADNAGSTVRSDSKHVQFIRDLAASVGTLQAKTATLSALNDGVRNALTELKTCPYNSDAFSSQLAIVQTAVDKLNLENFANLSPWVETLNTQLAKVLMDRLKDATRYWVRTFTAADDANFHAQPDDEALKLYSTQFPPILIEVVMNNQTIHLEPPLNFAKASWLQHLESWLEVVCKLDRVQATRYQIASTSKASATGRRFDLLPSSSVDVVRTAHSAVDEKIASMAEYASEWFRYQSLWDLKPESLQESIGEDLDQWHQLLQEIRQARSTFDTSDVKKILGEVVFDYEQVQSKISQKYDQWQSDVTSKFGAILGGRMREVYAELKRGRSNLEGQHLESSTTAQAVAFITTVQQCKRDAASWEPEIEIFGQGQTTLSRQRYSFASDWLSATQVGHEWESFREILERKSRTVTEQTDALEAKIIAEDGMVNARIKDTITQWTEEKPVSGSTPPSEALSILQTFSSRLERLQNDFNTVARAKEALALPSSSEESLTTTSEEVQDFLSVWSSLSAIWQRIDDLRDMLWASVQPRKVRQSLDGLVKNTRDMPSRMRQYAAFEHVQNVIRQLLKCNPLLADLKTDAVRERHWIKIFKTLKPGKRYSEVSMTLGDVWDLQLTTSDATVREIIRQAQGELALENFIKQVRDTWQNYTLDLVNYQSKIRLIRGWDELFAKCGENLNGLQSMRHSTFYKEFEEDASAWEDRLNRVHVLFDVWIDVQRQWVYLEGVFSGNNDIKHLLPTESSRFANINTEFTTVMRKVSKSPLVLDVLSIAGVQKSLERLAELLSKIQKALGEYLERERVAFPRFYFVGDEDLLEIIGNSNDTSRIAKHFKKMFAGISGLEVNEDNAIIAVTSREGERLVLRREVSLVKLPKINDWLAALESSIKITLAESLAEAVAVFEPLLLKPQLDSVALQDYLDTFPAQVMVLATQVVWTRLTQKALEDAGAGLENLLDQEVQVLALLADVVLQELPLLTRKKCEHLITEAVHQRDVLSKLIRAGAASPGHYMWLLQMRYVYDGEAEMTKRLYVEMANARLEYGYEYLGALDRLVRTPLTDRCFLTLTQALSQRLGGSPYGPAGTGKTESVKALGLQVGRFTLVFCCDDTFDFQAMGRIFLGLCRVGAWGCFDEFNRLEERILSAVSQQIQNIQIGLRNSTTESQSLIDLVGRRLNVNPDTGLFITMNPGYAGRSNLPDNLKKLFRSVAMSKPDKELIAEVMLFSQGFKTAKQLAAQAVPLFDHCARRLSKQPHYDFGLRALKSVLISSGGLKRMRLKADEHGGDLEVLEPQIMVQSIRDTIGPKLIKHDVHKLIEIQQEDFPGVEYVPADLSTLKAAIEKVMRERHLTPTESWITKILQLYQIQTIHHGVMMVGPSGSGKSQIWKVLLKALEEVEKVEGVCHVINPKVMSKEALYGNLDSTTREWTDGLFTATLRKIVDNLRGEDQKRHWIVFDGDVDPEWVENLNSVLDDNKILTLPNGERLGLPPNVRIMFEVQDLRYATLATVSRCGMVWFSDDIVTPQLLIQHALQNMRVKNFEDLDGEFNAANGGAENAKENQAGLVGLIADMLDRNDFLIKALDEAEKLPHIMEYTCARALDSFFSLLSKVVRSVLEYNINHPDFPLDEEQNEAFVSKKVLLSTVWGLTGDCPLSVRRDFGASIAAMSNVDTPDLSSMSLIDYDVRLPRGQWVPWQSQVPLVEINTHSVTQTDVIIPTVDTVRHEDVLYSWLAEHKPLLLCGPPGSGKTMILFSALRKLPDMEVVGLNFSSATQPDLLVKTFEQYCEYKKTLSGMTLSPTQLGRWLVVFCDEINLPAPDKYGTQRAISFLRQLVEQNGFWRTADKTWVTLERIQFVGACNPPTDVGRHPLGPRFLRHAPVIMVDYPGELSLTQIYGTFNQAILKIIPGLRGYAEELTKAMVQFYLRSRSRFTPEIQPHYVYSPRELTRWVRGVYEALRPLEHLSLEGLVRIWAHEALRLFQDRLVQEDERAWTAQTVREVASEHFTSADLDAALQGPILFSNWLSKDYISVEQEELREFVKARLRTFCEEEVDVPLVLFNDVLEHALRIDRVFRQPQGHLILIGTSGSGKTTLSRFVAWMNGLSIFQIKVHGKYSGEDFDEDLRGVLRACGTRGRKICFIMDESNVLDSGFLERMNTLLANGEIPGLFEGDQYSALMTACKEGAQRQGLLLDSQEELYKWFTQQVVRNLHVVFTMNPPQEGLSSRAATSPALFNRCVLNWMGNWSDQALYQVGLELTQSVDLDRADFKAPDSIPLAYQGLSLPASHRDAIVNAMVYVHHSVQQTNGRLEKQLGKTTYLTPRHYLDFVAQFVKLFHEKREDLEDQQRHLNVGLEKLRDTVDKVSDLRSSLAQKRTQLEQKDAEANEKLQRMVADQREAETRKSASLEIQTALERQEREIAARKTEVLNDLAKAEPAVVEAQRSVSNIKRQHLTEVRSMGNPPSGVKLALESVCTLLGNKVDSWKTIQSIVRREDFIASIVNYDNEQKMTPNLRVKMRNDFLSNDDFTYERVNRASKACGPLVQWVEAQVNYSEILDRVGPLRAQVEQLEDEALQTKAEAKAIENTIAKLEDSIARYKIEYAALISETQAIKTEMSRVQLKVDRSVRLLNSLSSERVRWEAGSKSFENQIQSLVGDVVIASAFLAYAGYYDQQFRKNMADDWLHHLAESGITCKVDSILGYLSTADDRLKWQRNSLPVDDLCTENAIMLQRFNRYPLIIDPSSRAVEFLKQEYSDRKITVTSFLDDGFTKQLESALRFGNAILIQDAEYLDPILNHVLNKEYQKTGGRVLIQLGKQEIDFSPTFKLYLSTRDPSASFAPDICSRTTFINFTVTQSSLKSQSLNDVLKAERPDIDKRRTNLIKMQGEFNTNLRMLERKLLQALNESRGNILDDDHVIQTLETLKKEASVISRKVRETDGVMAEVNRITRDYDRIAQACSSIFATLELLHHLNPGYQFSLQYFLDIFHDVLRQNKHLHGQTDHALRKEIILRELFVEAYRRTSLSLLQKDQITFALLLVKASPFEVDDDIFELLVSHQLQIADKASSGDEVLNLAKRVPPFSDTAMDATSTAWTHFVTAERAETCTPILWSSDISPLNEGLLRLLLVKVARPDRFLPAAEMFVSSVFGPEIFGDTIGLGDVVRQVKSTTPIALSSNPGFDASYKIEALVERQGASCQRVAMGTDESSVAADRAISSAVASGTWVLVKNVHLAPQWLQSLEKRLGALKPHADFRLFLSMETSPNIPVNLIRASRSLMYEQPAGIRANMKDTLSVLSERGTQGPVEKARLYFLLSFLHAVLQERLRYAPTLGWKGFWEFNDSDYECCAFIIDTWITAVAHGRSNIAPVKLPWDLLRTLVTEMYGGKIDDQGDFDLLDGMVKRVFDAAAYESEHTLALGEGFDEGLVVPTGTKFQDFLGWLDQLPEREPPTYLGLPANAEKLLLVGQGQETVRNLGRIVDMLEEKQAVSGET